jgi:hypothetical protein
MDCLRSFVVASTLNQSWNLGAKLDTWTVGSQHFWEGSTATEQSFFYVEGFKNINIYGVDLIGDFRTGGSASSDCIITDWRVTVEFVGQPALVGGEVRPAVNLLSVNIDTPDINSFQLSRYKTKVEFSSPIQSVTEIKFRDYSAEGYGNESLTQVNVNWNLKYVFYYNYEGE